VFVGGIVGKSTDLSATNISMQISISVNHTTTTLNEIGIAAGGLVGQTEKLNAQNSVITLVANMGTSTLTVIVGGIAGQTLKGVNVTLTETKLTITTPVCTTSDFIVGGLVGD
jgi:hypothetical protein